MRVLYFIVSLGISMPLIGQESSYTYSAAPQSSYSDEQALFRQQIQKEQELQEYLLLFSQLAPQDQDVQRKRIKTLLYQVLDLDIRQKEARIRSLRQELKLLMSGAISDVKRNDAMELQAAIQNAEISLHYRKNNRELLVERRMEKMGITR